MFCPTLAELTTVRRPDIRRVTLAHPSARAAGTHLCVSPPSVAFCSTQDKEPPSLAIQMADLFPLRSRVFALSPHLSPVRLRFVCPVRTRNKKVRCPPLFSVRLTGVCLVTRAGPRHLADVTRKARWAERIAGVCGLSERRRRTRPPSIPFCLLALYATSAGCRGPLGSWEQHSACRFDG